MNKYLLIIIALATVGILLFYNPAIFKLPKPVNNHEATLSLPSFSLPSLKIVLGGNELLVNEVWGVFQKYLSFAKAHDLPGLRTVSHQISATCNDSAKEKECFSLMDNVVNLGNILRLEDFTHAAADDHQIVMYTDGPTVAILYFTREDGINPKVLGMRFCLEENASSTICVDEKKIKEDSDKDGWWDTVESLFYKTP